MNSRIATIASNTFREAVRDRVLYNLIAFAVLLSGAAILVGQISIDIEKLVVINLGLTAVSLFGVVIAIFVGIGLVSKEIEKRTLYTVLSRPVRRWEFIVGKFFGLAGTLVVNTFFMAIGVFAALLYVAHKFQKPDGWVLVALYFIILQFLIICSLALLFSSFSSPLLSAVFAFSLFVIGTFSEDLRNFAGMATGLTKWLATAVAYLRSHGFRSVVALKGIPPTPQVNPNRIPAASLGLRRIDMGDSVLYLVEPRPSGGRG